MSKKFYGIDPWFICKKQTMLEKPDKSQLSGLLRAFVNYGRKKFYINGQVSVFCLAIGRDPGNLQVSTFTLHH
jgi:hypothetical protein